MAQSDSVCTYPPKPELADFDSAQAWYSALTKWFIDVGFEVNEREPRQLKKTRQIIGMMTSKPMKLKTFRRSQDSLVAGGCHTEVGDHRSNPCPVCDSEARIGIEMRGDNVGGGSYLLCLSCWHVVETIPLYGDIWR